MSTPPSQILVVAASQERAKHEARLRGVYGRRGVRYVSEVRPIQGLRILNGDRIIVVDPMEVDPTIFEALHHSMSLCGTRAQGEWVVAR